MIAEDRLSQIERKLDLILARLQPTARQSLAEICPKDNRLKAARVAAGLTQTQLAALVGCDQIVISRIECGTNTKAKDEYKRKISDVLGVPTFELFQK